MPVCAPRKQRFGFSSHSSVRLLGDVTQVRRARGHTVLVSPDGSAATRISAVGETLLPLLVRGTSVDLIAAFLQRQYPSARDIPVKLHRFLKALEIGGLLANGQGPTKRRPSGGRRFALFNPDHLAIQLARWWEWIPGSQFLVVVLLVTAAIGLVVVGLEHGEWLNPIGLMKRFEPIGLAFFVLVIVPLHELSHAVACRAAGVPVTAAGIMWHSFLIPGPYVETTQAYRVQDRRRRFWIPATGLLVDVLASGAAAWMVVLTHGNGLVGRASLYVLLLSGLFVYLDSNPLTPSDGSHMLEALLDDELARASGLSRGPATLSTRLVINTYRLACIGHFLLAALFLSWFVA